MPKPDGLGTYMSLSNRFADYGLPPVTLALEQRARRQGGRGGVVVRATVGQYGAFLLDLSCESDQSKHSE